MADAADSKSVARKGVWVQVPPLVFNFLNPFLRLTIRIALQSLKFFFRNKTQPFYVQAKLRVKS